MKAILVLEMPSSCDVCPFVRMIGNNFICTPKENSKEFCSVYYQVKNEIRPDWCPLKPAPEKRHTLDNFWEMCANIVRNACIDEILGDKE